MIQASPSTIRPARPGDEERIFELIGELAAFEHLEHQVTGSAEELGRQLFGSVPVAWSLVIEYDEQIVGYALCFSTFSSFLTQAGVWLEDIFITERLRGRGLGKALFNAVVNDARQRGAGRLEWSVLDWNEKASNFYRNQGAEVLPDWRICRMTGLS